MAVNVKMTFIYVIILITFDATFNDGVYGSISCSNSQYTTLSQCTELTNPTRFGEDRIYLYSNDIIAIPANSFQSFTQLTHLSLDHNSINDVGLEDYAFNGCGVMEYLNLYRNQLASLRRSVKHF